MSKREEITDVINDSAFDDPKFKKGMILVFDKTTLKLTKVDRKNKRVWAEHISMYEMDKGMSHYGHNVDITDPHRMYCSDCEVEISVEANETGEAKAIERQLAKEKAEAPEKVVKESKRRFRYVLLKEDGSEQHFAAGRRKKKGDLIKILGSDDVNAVPPPYYPQKYMNATIYGNMHASWDEHIRNPFMNVLQGDPDLGEPAEFLVVGDVIAEIEIIT